MSRCCWPRKNSLAAGADNGYHLYRSGDAFTLGQRYLSKKGQRTFLQHRHDADEYPMADHGSVVAADDPFSRVYKEHGVCTGGTWIISLPYALLVLRARMSSWTSLSRR